jgi:hypothetical protein
MKTSDKKKCIDLAKKIAKERDGYICQKCGRSLQDGWQQHGAHIMPVGWSGTCADPDNIICLCATCHSVGKKSSHEDPVGYSEWFNKQYPGLYKKMRDKAYKYSANPFPKIDWAELYEELKGQLNQTKLL